MQASHLLHKAIAIASVMFIYGDRIDSSSNNNDDNNNRNGTYMHFPP